MLIQPSAMHGLMASIMEAHYKDLLEIKRAYNENSTFPEETSNVKMLEAEIMSLIMKTVSALDSGELNIFHCDYRQWLVDAGYMQEPLPAPKQPVDTGAK